MENIVLSQDKVIVMAKARKTKVVEEPETTPVEEPETPVQTEHECDCSGKREELAGVAALYVMDIIVSQINIARFWEGLSEDDVKRTVYQHMFRTNSELITFLSEEFGVNEESFKNAQSVVMSTIPEEVRGAFIHGYRLVANSMMPKELRRPEFPFIPILYDE
jgi:predicted Ser/Thr protein kinase